MHGPLSPSQGEVVDDQAEAAEERSRDEDPKGRSSSQEVTEQPMSAEKAELLAKQKVETVQEAEEADDGGRRPYVESNVGDLRCFGNDALSFLHSPKLSTQVFQDRRNVS